MTGERGPRGSTGTTGPAGFSSTAPSPSPPSSPTGPTTRPFAFRSIILTNIIAEADLAPYTLLFIENDLRSSEKNTALKLPTDLCAPGTFLKWSFTHSWRRKNVHRISVLPTIGAGDYEGDIMRVDTVYYYGMQDRWHVLGKLDNEPEEKAAEQEEENADEVFIEATQALVNRHLARRAGCTTMSVRHRMILRMIADLCTQGLEDGETEE